ncbi:hypothetical protein RZS08_49035, partial [Arthrospira platensis SPKY1]|nr:hypothetical protein [Arthrospira platensis SPKY1]
MQVERETARHQMGQHRAVHMYGPFGLARGAAGEVQQAHGLGRRGADHVLCRHAVDQLGPAVHPGLGRQRIVDLAH